MLDADAGARPESDPLEEAVFIRDEMANLVWGIIRRIVLPSGTATPGGAAGQQLFAFLQEPLADELRRLQARRAELEAIPARDRTTTEDAELAAIVARLAQILPPEPAARIRYQAINTVPEHWIPFIPMHLDGSVRETQLQRAAMLRILTGDPNPPEKVRPRTRCSGTDRHRSTSSMRRRCRAPVPSCPVVPADALS